MKHYTHITVLIGNTSSYVKNTEKKQVNCNNDIQCGIQTGMVWLTHYDNDIDNDFI